MNRLFLAIALGAAVFALDQFSKYAVLEWLNLRAVGRMEVAPFLDFALAYNRGVNFGLLASESPWAALALVSFATLVSIGLLIWAAYALSDWVAAGCGLVAGGALANALDRILDGAVIDFLNFDCCGIGNPYSFNLADSAIFLGAVLLAIYGWSDEPKDEARSGDAA